MVVYHGFYKNIKKPKLFCNFDNTNWAQNKHIRIIYEGSCDTEDWSSVASFKLCLYFHNFIFEKSLKNV